MKNNESKKHLIIEKLSDHLLTQGMNRASLRTLAAAAGTSDRMLLHYFSDKEELLTATLVLIAKRLIIILDNAHSEPMPFRVLLPHLAEMLKDPHIRPYLKLWLELAALASGGEDYYRIIANQICSIFFDWIAAALKVEREEDRNSLASLALATIEGFVLLDIIGSGSLISSALEGINIC